MQVTRKSNWSGKIHTRDINISQKQLYREKIPDNLSFYDKQFLKTGMTPEEIDEQDSGSRPEQDKRYDK
jgi:hypothetical protein